VKKLFEEILLEYRCKVKKRVKHEWQKKRDFGEEIKEKNDRHQKAPKLNHLPSLLPLLTDF